MPKRAYVSVDGVARKCKKIYVGVDDIARKVKKAYVGINGIARQWWSSGELRYYGQVTKLPELKRGWMATATVGDYALFAGGTDEDSNETKTVYAYNKDLTLTKATSLRRNLMYHAGASIGNYALFGGGYDGSSYQDEVYAYDSALTMTTVGSRFSGGLQTARSKLAAEKIGNYALFVGGFTDNSSVRGILVDAIDASLTQTKLSNLASGIYNHVSAANENYALFGGGMSGNSETTLVYAYNASLTVTTPSSLSKAVSKHAATTAGEYVLFGGGSNSTSVVDAYDKNLTKTIPEALSVARYALAATKLGTFGIFAGGLSGGTDKGTVDVYDESLTRTNPGDLQVPRIYLAAETVGNYALFVGGTTNNSGTTNTGNIVEAYIYEE